MSGARTQANRVTHMGGWHSRAMFGTRRPALGSAAGKETGFRGSGPEVFDVYLQDRYDCLRLAQEMPQFCQRDFVRGFNVKNGQCFDRPCFPQEAEERGIDGTGL